jgi:hypothetical protein
VAFDGVNDRVEVPYAAALNPAPQFTIEAWVRPTGGTGTWQDFFVGRLDEATVYPTALSPARIQAHYNAR